MYLAFAVCLDYRLPHRCTNANHGNEFKSELIDPTLPSKLNALMSTIPSHPVGAESILNPLRTRGTGSPRKVAPPPNKTPFFIQFIACVPSVVNDPLPFTGVLHDWIRTG